MISILFWGWINFLFKGYTLPGYKTGYKNRKNQPLWQLIFEWCGFGKAKRQKLTSFLFT